MNEQITEAAQKVQENSSRPVIGDEVIGFNHINYIKVAPARHGQSGCDWTSVYCLDVGGMVPHEFLTKL